MPSLYERRIHENRDVTTEDIMAILRGDLTPDDIRRRRLEKQRKRRVGYLQHQYEQELEKKSVRELIAMRRAMYRVADDYYGIDEEIVYEAMRWALIKVLARKPHVRKSGEALRTRRALARMFRGQGKGKNR